MLAEIFVSEGEGEPYIVVPDQFKIALFEWLKDKIPCTFPRSGGWIDNKPMNAVLELVDASPKETEKPLDKWFETLSIAPEKQFHGDENNPTGISWRFDPNIYEQAQAEWLKKYRQQVMAEA